MHLCIYVCMYLCMYVYHNPGNTLIQKANQLLCNTLTKHTMHQKQTIHYNIVHRVSQALHDATLGHAHIHAYSHTQTFTHTSEIAHRGMQANLLSQQSLKFLILINPNNLTFLISIIVNVVHVRVVLCLFCAFAPFSCLFWRLTRL
jgi:hypothetical protein